MNQKMKVVKANPRDGYRRIFYEREATAGALLAALEALEETAPLGWQARLSLICAGLWGRRGSFCSASETFVDAFDHTVYKTTVWKYSKENEEGSIDGVELHAWDGMTEASAQDGVILLETAGGLKRLLAGVPADTPVFAPSSNFELKGNLVHSVGFYCIRDVEGREWAILETEDL